MEQKNIVKKISCWDDFQEVVYKLIYPALLGSMIYAIFLENSPHRLFKIGVAFFYFCDYYHLYTYAKKQQTSSSVILNVLDVAVSVFLCIAFNTEYKIAFLFLCGVPCCFAIYTWQLKIKIGKIPLWAMHFGFGVISSLIAISTYFCFWDKVEIIAPSFILVMICINIVIACLEKIHNPISMNEYIELQSNKKDNNKDNNKYRVYINGRSKETFEKVELKK